MNIPDPGFGFFSNPDPGSRYQKKPRIPDQDPQHWKIPVPFWEIRRAHFLRTHDMSEITGGWQQFLWVDMTKISGGWQQCLWVDMTEIS
jgi:hypothetical protein